MRILLAAVLMAASSSWAGYTNVIPGVDVTGAAPSGDAKRPNQSGTILTDGSGRPVTALDVIANPPPGAQIQTSVSNTGDLIGTVTLTRSTVGTGNFLANAVAVTYTIQINGTESGVTIFADVSNADSMPPVTDAKQWETLTPNGLVPVARPASTLGSVGNNTFYANGYRWMKWRAEAWCPTCGPT